MNGSTLLAVMAHADDAELWAGGTLARHARGENRAVVLIGCDEGNRIQEAREGAQELGAVLRVVPSLTREICIDAIRELEAEVVITHRYDDVHPDHRIVSEMAISAAQKAAIGWQRSLRLYTCDTYNSMTISGHVPGTAIIDIDHTFETKVRALSRHKSQPCEYFSQMVERQARLWGARIGCCWAEAFDPVPVLGIVPARALL